MSGDGRGARLEGSEAGLVGLTDGWFVVNVRDAAWVTSDAFGAACIFEGDETPFADLGFTLGVLSPGKPSGLFHSEATRRTFSSCPASVCCSSRVSSGLCRRGTSSTARRTPSTSSWVPETARASSSWRERKPVGRRRASSIRVPSWHVSTAREWRRRRARPAWRTRRFRDGGPGHQLTGTACPGPSAPGGIRTPDPRLRRPPLFH